MNEQSALWEYTNIPHQHAKQINKFQQNIKPDGRRENLYQGRAIIGRDTPINGGVYFYNQDEAVVVDDQADKRLMPIYGSVIQKIEQIRRTGIDPKGQILNIVYETVARLMPYDTGAGDRVHQRVGDNHKVYLGEFIGGGVCRHQGLLAAYLLEKLKTNGYVRGTVSVDRNQILGRGGHAWARYTNSAGVVYILDVAQHYLGELKKKKNLLAWNYERPEDKTLRKNEKRNNGGFWQNFQRGLRKIFNPYKPH